MQLYQSLTTSMESTDLISIFSQIHKAVAEDNIDNLKSLCCVIEKASKTKDLVSLQSYYYDSSNPLRSSNLVILACKHNKVKILKYLFSNDCKILNNLAVISRAKASMSPRDVDETSHNAFYYAIRSGNTELLDVLMNKWPLNYFASRPAELDEILSIAYEELKLKNIPLSSEMEIFVENKLIDMRFFSNSSYQNQIRKSKFNKIIERVELIAQSTRLLKIEYSAAKEVDAKFLFRCKFIAQNIHILKRQLKCTYDKLPWEEMEFCLVSFISSHIRRQEMNLFYQTTLNEHKILNYLEHFSNKLECEIKFIDIKKRAELPKIRREEVLARIINNSSEFEELYNDYQQIRDLYSLEKISVYAKLALSINPKEREGQLIIMRVLQVIGEYLKNTLESPKLSNTTSDLFLLSLSKNTRNVVIDLRNSLSHAYSLSKRTEIEERKDANFFVGVQNDTKKISDTISEILYGNKIKIIRILLKRIVDSEDIEEIKKTVGVLRNAEITEMISQDVKLIEHVKLEELISELKNNVTDMTIYEKSLFSRIDDIINSVMSKTDNTEIDYKIGCGILRGLYFQLTDNIADNNTIRTIKYSATETLKYISPKIESTNVKEIVNHIEKISECTFRRLQPDNVCKVMRLVLEITKIAECGMDNIKFIEDLTEKISTKNFFMPFKQRTHCHGYASETYYGSAEKLREQFESRLNELKNILSNNELNDNIIKKLHSHKNNKQLQSVVEMLVLDIMSILEASNSRLENNFLFLDDNAPILIGKSLRNHLAHDNGLLDVLLFDPSMAIMLNAIALTEKDIIKNGKKIGKLLDDNSTKLKRKYNHDLVILNYQRKMFIALEEGNLEGVKNFLKKGADINARDINLWTALHFAAKGPSLECVKFISDQTSSVIAKDINGCTPLHIAAANGRAAIVGYFLHEVKLDVNVTDFINKTPLHIAAQNGHIKTVMVLLHCNADSGTKDILGHSPVHYAIRNHHTDVAKTLLEREIHVDLNEVDGGFTPLHIAAEYGNLEVVHFLLKNGADVYARTDKKTTALHLAALHGHTETVEILIGNGADVNATVIDGCTPLHHAVETGRREVTNILLKSAANVNVCDKTFYNTPLHYAAKDGHEEIAKALLTKKADTSAMTVEGVTPLHFAVEKGHLNIVSLFLKYSVNVHIKDKRNCTSLHVAALSDHKKIAELLISYGADVNARAENYSTPLHLAALQGCKDVIDLLIKNKAKIDAEDITGMTPLHQAAIHDNKDIIEFLIEKGAKVNAKTHMGIAALRVAAQEGHKDTINTLIKNGAEVNVRDNNYFTPLHAAAQRGCKDVVSLLIQNNAEVNAKCAMGFTPLHVAVEAGHEEIIEILIAGGADVNTKTKSTLSPLSSAVKNNHKEIVKILMENGADINTISENLLSRAVFSGYADVVETLLEHNDHINYRDAANWTLLHTAAAGGHKEVVNILMSKGVNINAVADKNVTPLHAAVEGGHEEVAEILVANRAEVNIQNSDGGTALHTAAAAGHTEVVKMLLSNNASGEIKDNKNRTSLELAVVGGHLEAVKEFFRCSSITSNINGNKRWPILHLAAEGGNLEIVKYLTSKGYDINMRNSLGSKPMHIAAREGHKHILDFFLNEGLDINDPGADNQTVLHYIAAFGHLELMKYLITLGADVNAKDIRGITPILIATRHNHNEIIKLLLESGACYDVLSDSKIEEFTELAQKNIFNPLYSTRILFEAVKQNMSSEIEKWIKRGACVDAKNADNVTPLHYAAWKGYTEIVNILLRNKANPNSIGKKSSTPLHYAVKFSHFNIVITLLSYGAVYNAASASGKVPLNFARNDEIISILNLIAKAFQSTRNNNIRIIQDLNKIKDINKIKAIMNACNSENKTLIVVAMQNGFSMVKELKEICQDGVSDQIELATTFAVYEDYENALIILNSVLETRISVLGTDNPGTLDIQKDIAKFIYKRGDYQEALNMLEKILHKQTNILGLNDKDTLHTQSTMALILHRQGRDDEALTIFQEVCQKQKEILGADHLDTLESQFHLALVLDRKGRYDEALHLNTTVFENRKRILGENHIITTFARNNIAMVLTNQKKWEEALTIYQDVYEKKKNILGAQHADTLRTLHHIAVLLVKQKKYSEALTAHEDIYNIQNILLGENHPDTLNTLYNIGEILFDQRKWISALKTYRESFDRLKAVFGPLHPSVQHIIVKLQVINYVFKLEGSDPSEILKYLQTDINNAASNGDVKTVKRLIENGVDPNDKDIDGRTSLHYAANSGRIDIVKILLENGADATQTTNKGNTPLHTAASTGNKDIVEILLQDLNHEELSDFINARTTLGGTTALHVAAKNGFLQVVKCLLTYGAIYNIENKECETPLDLTKDKSVIGLLTAINDLFNDVQHCDLEMIAKLGAVPPDEFKAIAHARNRNGYVLSQVAMIKNRKHVAKKILEMLQKSN